MESIERDGSGLNVFEKNAGRLLGRVSASFTGDRESWKVYCFIPRRLAKGNMKELWNNLVRPAGSGRAGDSFSGEPQLKRIAGEFDGGFLFMQSGGMDI